MAAMDWRANLEGTVARNLRSLRDAVLSPKAAATSGEKVAELASRAAPVIWLVGKVQAGKVDDYLKGLKRGFVPAAELAKKNGTLVDYQILVNRNQVAPGATVLILEKYADWSQFAPNKERDLKKRAELRKTLPKEESDKLVNGFNGYRTFVDEGSYWGVEFAK